MGLAASVCMVALVSAADIGLPNRTAPKGIYEKPIQRYVQVLYDFMAPPPLTPMTPGAAPPEGLPPIPPAGVPPVATPPVVPPPVAPGAQSPVFPPGMLSPPTPPMPPIQLATGTAQVGGVSLPALCLHPEGLQPGVVSFPSVWIRPVAGEWPRIFLLFRVGLADPLLEPEEGEEANPVTLTVSLGDRPIFSEEITQREWTLRAVDVTSMAGEMGDVAFRASTLDPEMKPGVLCVAEPRLVEEQGIYFQSGGGRGLPFGFSMTRFPRGRKGLGFAQVQATMDSVVEIGLGDASERFEVAPGTHWLPIEFSSAGRFSFRPVQGDAELLRLDAAPVAEEEEEKTEE